MEKEPRLSMTGQNSGSVCASDKSAVGTTNKRGWFHKLSDACRILGQIIYGMTIYDMVRDLNKERGNLERLFVAVVWGDLLGVPILPPYYSLRLFPYIIPSITALRLSMLRERDLTDLCDQDIT